MIVNIFDGTEQPLAFTLTVIVATKGAAVLLIVANDGILPVPLAPNPICVLSFDQL